MKHTMPGRPKGARQINPTKAEIAAYIRLLRDAANEGDTTAAAALVNLASAQQITDTKRKGVQCPPIC